MMSQFKLKSIMRKLITACLFIIPLSAFAVVHEDPAISSLKIDHFEILPNQNSNPLAFEGEFWTGHDINRLVIKSDLEYADDRFEEMQWDGLFSHAISAYWNLQGGLRYNSIADQDQYWATVGVQGVAPYFFDTDLKFSVSDEGQTAVDIDTEYELLLTQKLMLIPNVSASLYGQSDAKYEQGSGLANLGFGLRLGYQIKREIQPYFGWKWSSDYGETRDYKNSTSEWNFVVGISGWI